MNFVSDPFDSEITSKKSKHKKDKKKKGKKKKKEKKKDKDRDKGSAEETDNIQKKDSLVGGKILEQYESIERLQYTNNQIRRIEVESEQECKQNFEQDFERNSEQYTEQYSEQYTEQYSEQFTEQYSEQYTEQYSEQYTEQYSEQYTEQYSEQYTEQYSEQYTEQAPEQDLQQFSEQDYESGEEVLNEEDELKLRIRNERKADLEALIHKSIAEGFGYSQMKPDTEVNPTTKEKENMIKNKNRVLRIKKRLEAINESKKGTNKEYDNCTFGGLISEIQAEKKRKRDEQWIRKIKEDTILNRSLEEVINSMGDNKEVHHEDDKLEKISKPKKQKKKKSKKSKNSKHDKFK